MRNKRNKKYNPAKRATSYALPILKAQVNSILSTKYLAYEPSMCDGVQCYGADAKPWKVTKPTALALSKVKTTWTISCYLLVREKNGKNKLINYPVDITTPCTHNQIVDEITNIHWGFVEEYPHKELILTAGWIANRLGLEPSDELAYDIFDDMGCWRELIADFEEASEI